MCDKSGKCQVESVLRMHCGDRDGSDCTFYKPKHIPAVPEKDRVDLLSQINNPDFVIEAKTIDNVYQDVMEGGKYKKKRKADGTH